MSRAKTVMFSVAALVTACADAEPISVNDRRQMASAESALRAYDAVLTKMDTANLRALVTPDFRMHEDNMDLDLNESIRSVAAVIGSGTMQRELHNVSLQQRGPVAWARYRVRVTLVTGKESMSFDRVESAILENRDGRWLMAFATSMPYTHR